MNHEVNIDNALKITREKIVFLAAAFFCALFVFTVPTSPSHAQSLGDFDISNIGSLENVDVESLGNMNVENLGDLGVDVGEIENLNIGDLQDFGVDVGDLGDLNLSDLGDLDISDLQNLGVDIGDIANFDIGDLQNLGIDIGDIGGDIANLDIGDLGNFDIGDLQDLGIDIGDLGNFDIGDLGDFGFDIGDLGNFDIGDLGNFDIGDLGNFGIDIADLGNFDIGDLGIDIGDLGIDIGNLGNFDFSDLGSLGIDIGDLGSLDIDFGDLGIDLDLDLGIDFDIDLGGLFGFGGSDGDLPLTEGIALDDSYAGYTEEDMEVDALEKWVASLMHMTKDFSATFMHQAASVGGFFDAQNQAAAQRTIQGMTAQAHKDYHPSMQLCRFGTNIRSLHTTEHLQRTNTDLMNIAILRRETLSAYTLSSAGPDTEIKSRLAQFKKTYCDTNDNNEGLDPMCEGSSGPAERVNRDIDYTRLLDNAYTLDVDLTDTTDTPDEQDIFSLSRNLFSHKSYTDIPETTLKLEHTKDDYQNLRSLQTVRGIARNSFSHIVGMKAKGTIGTAPYMYKMLEEFGMDEENASFYLGENPSYFAQMEVLTKQMYLQPSFYTNLYDKPANVERISASLQAMGLMQDRDRFEASLRREMLVSMLLELSLRQKQEVVGTETVKSVSRLFIETPE